MPELAAEWMAVIHGMAPHRTASHRYRTASQPHGTEWNVAIIFGVNPYLGSRSREKAISIRIHPEHE
ncbi:MAG: hypothetical protein EA363_11685 [Balneolaceae bacterium]|nr:MAG: hypothetical protein EA363_11685 [Balneolaceae bacterium]